MTDNRRSIIAACGLLCSDCEIYLAPGNPERAQEIAEVIAERTQTPCEPEWIKCSSCKGLRDECWSPDCEILSCCVDEHDLENCSLCDEFPCGKLRNWANRALKYKKAFDRLVSLRGEE